MIKLAISDMDNTLIPIGEAHVSYETVYAIHRLRRAGVQFGPCTGRDSAELFRMFRGDESCYATGILSNGKKVLIDGEIVDLHLFDNACLQLLADALSELKGVFINLYPYHTTADNAVWSLNAPTGVLSGFERRFKFNAIEVSRVPDEQIIGVTIAFTGSDTRTKEIRHIMAETTPDLESVLPASNWLDVLPRGVNKATAYDVLIRKLGMENEEAAVFGDSENDLAVMKHAINSVAVANATPEVATAARWHVGPCLDDGVAIALEDIAYATEHATMPRFMSESDS